MDCRFIFCLFVAVVVVSLWLLLFLFCCPSICLSPTTALFQYLHSITFFLLKNIISSINFLLFKLKLFFISYFLFLLLFLSSLLYFYHILSQVIFVFFLIVVVVFIFEYYYINLFFKKNFIFKKLYMRVFLLHKKKNIDIFCCYYSCWSCPIWREWKWVRMKKI